MTEKIFTEEQYNAIADFGDTIIKSGKMYLFGKSKEIMEIANPVTREKAKEKYVEKEVE